MAVRPCRSPQPSRTASDRRLAEAAKVFLHASLPRRSGGRSGGRERIRNGSRRRLPRDGDWFCRTCSYEDPSFFVFKNEDNLCPRCGGHKKDHFGGHATTHFGNRRSTTRQVSKGSMDEMADLRKDVKQLEGELEASRAHASAYGVTLPDSDVKTDLENFKKVRDVYVSLFGKDHPCSIRAEADVQFTEERRAASLS